MDVLIVKNYDLSHFLILLDESRKKSKWKNDTMVLFFWQITIARVASKIIKDLTHIRWRRRGQRLVKNVFLLYFGISHLFGTIQCVCRY